MEDARLLFSYRNRSKADASSIRPDGPDRSVRWTGRPVKNGTLSGQLRI
jgi:hypothetical protein